MGDFGSVCLVFLVICIIVGIILGIYFGVKGSDSDDESENIDTGKFILTEGHKSRVSLLQKCMSIYGVENIPELKDEEFNSTLVTENKLLSITKLEIKGKKGETVEIFQDPDSLELEPGEYTCISFRYNDTDHMERITNGRFTIPSDMENEVSETEFTLILYFRYNPEINDEEYLQSLIEENNQSTSLVLYDENKPSKKIMRRRLSIFSRIENFFRRNFERIVERSVNFVVSKICVTLLQYLFQDYSNIIVDSVGQFACDELAEFVGSEVMTIIFNSESKPPENYKELLNEELKNYNFSQLMSSEAEMLRRTIMGDTKNEQELIKFIINRTNSERLRIKSSYRLIYGSDLIEDLKDELKGDFEDAVLPLFYDPIDYDCMELKIAMKGPGTDEDTLIEIITNRNNSVIRKIKQRYPIVISGSDLIENVIDDTSGNFRNTLVALLNERRSENTKINYTECGRYARQLNAYKDEGVYLGIFTERSKDEFVAIENLYKEYYGESLLDTVKDEFSGDFEDGLVGIYYAMVKPHEYFAKRIHDSIYGLGTDDETLIRVIVTRHEIDLPLIKKVYEEMYDADMIEDIIDDTSGDYQTLLVSLVKGEYAQGSFIGVNIRQMLIILLFFIIF